MKAILEFNLDNEDDRDEYKCAVNATALNAMVEDYYCEVLAPYYMHGIPSELQDADKLLDHLIEKFKVYKYRNGIVDKGV